MQRLEVSGAVRRLYGSLGFKGLKIQNASKQIIHTILVDQHLLLYCFSYSVNKLHVVTCRQAAVDPKLSHLNNRTIKFAIRPTAATLP